MQRIDTAVFELSAPDVADPSLLEVGEDESLVVIDDFYRDPARVRDAALAQVEWTPRRGFPGAQAVVETDTSRLYARILDWIDIEGVAPESECHDRAVFSIVTHKDRDLSPRSWGLPHFDGHSHIAGLVYLNTPEQCRGGTAFYRHRRTGLARWPDDAETMRSALRALEIDPADASDAEVARLLASALFTPAREPGFIRASNDAWELTALVEMKHNRAIFYETMLFHSAYTSDGDFGERLPERRLTQTLFLRIAG